MYCSYCKIGPNPLSHFSGKKVLKCRKRRSDEYFRNKAQYQKTNAKWRANNQDAVKQRRKTYHTENAQHIRDKVRQWRLENPEKHKQAQQKHYIENYEDYFWRAKFRKKRLKRATPPWLTAEQLAEIQHKYQMAQDMSILTGVKYSVDHMHPLQGKRLCGLHVPWNLRVILLSENIKKGNRY